MRFLLASAFLFAALFAAPVLALSSSLGPVADDCLPPCGPIPVIITITLEKSKGVTFDASNRFESDGKVQYYFDIDQNGYAYDPQKPVVMEFRVNKAPPWTRTTVEPLKIEVPVGDATHVGPEGSDQGQTQYSFEAPIKVTVEKTREPTADELKKWIRSDGTYRVTISASSNDSMAGSDATGRPAGLMEGYGVKEIRFTPESVPGASTDGAGGGKAPGPGVGAIVVGLAAATLVRFRRRSA